jgi:hypothetical protein
VELVHCWDLLRLTRPEVGSRVELEMEVLWGYVGHVEQAHATNLDSLAL